MKDTPKGWPRISAAVYYEDPSKAIDFLAKAFGFEVQVKHEENGVVVHSQLTLPGGLIMVGGLVSHGDPAASWRKSPKQIGGGNTQALFIYVDDADAHCTRARAAGAKSFASQKPSTTARSGGRTGATKRWTRKDTTGTSRTGFADPDRARRQRTRPPPASCSFDVVPSFTVEGRGKS